jgi:hypothetical protein
MFGKEIKFGEARTFGTYLDPRMVWYLSRNAELWSAYTSVVNLEPVPLDEQRYGATTYAGVQWRIPYDDMASRRAHYAFMEAALGIGLKRTIMDYGSIIKITVKDMLVIGGIVVTLSLFYGVTGQRLLTLEAKAATVDDNHETLIRIESDIKYIIERVENIDEDIKEIRKDAKEN